MSYIVYNDSTNKKGVRALVSKLKLARIASGMTQLELADAAGVTRQTIGLIEQGRFNPSLALCILLCRSLGKTLDDLFWEDEP